MEKKDLIEITVETPAIGNLLMKVEHSPNEEDGKFIIRVPRTDWGDYIDVDLSLVVKSDIEQFNRLNNMSDKYHQIYLDTLRPYGVKISGNYLRVQYYFYQDGNPEIHRMCAGALTHSFCDYYKRYADGKPHVVFPEGYSPDVCVYW